MTARAHRPSPCRPTALFAFAAGVALLQLLPVLPDIPFGIFLLPALAGLLLLPRLAVPAALVCGLAFAGLSAQDALSRRLPLEASGERGQALVRIVDLPRQAEDGWQFEAEILESADFPRLAGERVKLAWYRTPERLSAGDVWRFELLLRTPNGVRNPGGFDAEMRALQKGWAAQGYVRGQARRIGNDGGIDAVRERLSRRIASAMPGRDARFVRALALGDTRFLTEDDWDVLRRTGITHLIAISGFHVGIVALFAMYGLSGLYRLFPALGLRLPRPMASAMVAIAAAAGYATLAGFAVPTVRTALMIAVFMAHRLLHRSGTVVQAVAMSMAAILLWDPFALLASGFWLSFTGVLALVAFMPRAESGLLGPFLWAQWICTLVLLPLTLAFFGQTSLVSPAVNLLAIPLISLAIVPLALIGCVFAFLPTLAAVFWGLSAWLMALFWQGLLWLQQWPGAAVFLPEGGLVAVLAAMLGAGLCLLPAGVPGRWLGLPLMLPLLWPTMPDIPHQNVRVAMIDVGQGLSVLVRTRNHALLYDTGAGREKGFNRGESTVLPALRALDVGRLDKVVISHGDNDHAGGLSAIRKGIVVRRVDASGDTASPCRAGASWQWDGVRFSYLWPGSDAVGSDNDASCVLRIEAGARTLLLTGDIGEHAEAALVARHGAGLRAELMTVPHHGSATSSTAEFLDAVRPKQALVSSGFQNRFRHPRAEVVGRYRMRGATVWNSAAEGWVELAGDSAGWQLQRREREHGRRYWSRPIPREAHDGH
nr:DNA internalization-related competence protein ComEC/Rec2 [Arenimonas maotaiensis]